MICMPLSQKISMTLHPEMFLELYCISKHTVFSVNIILYFRRHFGSECLCTLRLISMPMLLDEDADSELQYAFVVSPIDTIFARLHILRGYFCENNLRQYASGLHEGRMVSINAIGSSVILQHTAIPQVIIRWPSMNTCRYCQVCAYHMKKCPSCWSKYCSDACSVADWSRHKKYCKAIRETLNISSDNGQRSERARMKLADFWSKDHCHRTYAIVSEYEYQMTKHLVLTRHPGDESMDAFVALAS